MRQSLLTSLRIAVTAVSLLVCGLLIVLWVRSYTRTEYMAGPISKSGEIAAYSSNGFIEINHYRFTVPWAGWVYDNDEPVRSETKWSLKLGKWSHVVSAPHWFFLTIFAAIAALPWIKWRFSLRTLLIVLTLFALFFGAISISL